MISECTIISFPTVCNSYNAHLCYSINKAEYRSVEKKIPRVSHF